jgi:glycosyltransferase involved in cell wall biosynthesis
VSHLVSIVIPVYNKAAYIRETLDSALVQSYTNFEIVLVNDGSTDGSLSILQEYADRFPAIVRLINSENRGVSAATNLGIQAAKGEYFQFLDADDLMSAEKIEGQIELLSGKGRETIATCEWVNFRDDIHQFSRVPYGLFQDFVSGLDLLLRFWNNQEMMAISSYLTHRDLIDKVGPWDENLTINQDGEFFCRILLKAKEVLFEPNGMVYYRKPGQDNVSQQKSEKAARSLLDSLKSYEKSVLEVEDSIRVRLALKKVYQKYLYDIFPYYPGLLNEARERMRALRVKNKTFVGGPKFQFLSRFLGFENALKLKRFIG